MDFKKMIDTLKAHPDYHKMGMIASHLGIVRGTSLKGGEVEAVEVSYDFNAIDNIIRDSKRMPGIVDVLVETCEGHLKVGDEVMAVAVGGDTREHVFPVLMTTVNRIKSEATKKKEIFQE